MAITKERLAEDIRRQIILQYTEIQQILKNFNKKIVNDAPYGIVDFEASDRKQIIAVMTMGSAGTKEFKSPSRSAGKKDTHFSDFDIWVVVDTDAFTPDSLKLLEEKGKRIVSELKTLHPVTFWFMSEEQFVESHGLVGDDLDSYLSLASTHLLDYFLATKTLLCGKDLIKETIDVIPAYEGYELSVLARNQLNGGAIGKAGIRAALGHLISEKKILPLSVMIDEQVKKIVKPDMSRAELVKCAPQIPTTYDVILGVIQSNQDIIFDEGQVKILETCFRLKSGEAALREIFQRTREGRTAIDYTALNQFYERIDKMITYIQKKIKPGYITELSRMDKKEIHRKLIDVEILYNRIRTWESCHNMIELIPGLNLSHYTVSVREISDETVYRVRMDYQEGNVIETILDDFFEFILFASKIKNSVELIRFSGKLKEEGYDRQSVKKLIKTVQNFLMSSEKIIEVKKLSDYTSHPAPQRLLVVQTQGGVAVLSAYAYGRMERLTHSDGKTLIFQDESDAAQIVFEKYFRHPLKKRQVMDNIEIKAIIPGINKLEETNFAQTFYEEFIKCFPAGFKNRIDIRK